MLAVAGYNRAFAALVPVWLPPSPPASHRVRVWVCEFGVGFLALGGGCLGPNLRSDRPNWTRND
jgi:hypothetical protein